MLNSPRSHAQAAAVMVAAAMMWSIAGVVTRQLQGTGPFEATFWRSVFCFAALASFLSWRLGPGRLLRVVREGGGALWLASGCWCVMFTAFMLAVSFTTVANVLVILALAPLFTALASRWVLQRPLPARTWWAIALAGAGMVWMYGQQFDGSALQGKALWGVLIALAVPLAAATNWTLLQFLAARRVRAQTGPGPVTATAAESAMPVAVLLGSALSLLLTWPLANPGSVPAADLAWLGLLGLVQLAIPCLLCVWAARTLPAPEASLLSLLEVIFGVLWAWLWGGEQPAASVLAGGAVVLTALAMNEALALREGRRGLRSA
jgi:drug/metabolite transporter (DMT)-like permease